MALSPIHNHPTILARVLSHLAYPDLISLSQTSACDRAVVGNPADRASFADKLAFVLRAEGTFAQHFPRSSGVESPGNFACFWCFRVRPPECFDNWQDNVFWNVVEGRAERVGEDLPGDSLLPSLLSSSSSQGHGHGQRQSQGPQRPAHPPHEDPRVLSGRLVGLRRFCIDCGLAHPLYVPGDTIQTKARDGREMWVCSCRELNNKTHTKCERCGDIAPMRPRKRWY